jgi:hypothetical protein
MATRHPPSFMRITNTPVVRKTKDGKPLVIWRAVPKQLAREHSNPKYVGAGLRTIRATHGVGRPVVSDVRS